jgi:hypothetical protein
MARFFIRLLLIALLMSPLSVVPALTQESHANHKNAMPSAETASSAASTSLLPQTFAGWQISGVPEISTQPQAADADNAAVLKEYGLEQYEVATYTRDGESLFVKAIQFGDATGAYGAFTFYRKPNMAEETIGQGAVFDGKRVLFWNGAVLVDAVFQHLTPMSASELRDLATQLPKPVGNQGIPPSLPGYLPAKRLRPMTVVYAIGPEAYRKSGGVLPAELVDFNRSAEVVTAQYDTLNGIGTLTIINYPTSEIALDRKQAVQQYFRSHGTMPHGASLPWTSAMTGSNPSGLQARRSGPLLAITSGSFSAGSAEELLQQVHYEVVMTQGGHGKYVPDTTKLAQIILSVAFLVGIFSAIAIVAALSLGGGRVLWRRIRVKSGAAPEEHEEFIRLNLKD